MTVSRCQRAYHRSGCVPETFGRTCCFEYPHTPPDKRAFMQHGEPSRLERRLVGIARGAKGYEVESVEVDRHAAVGAAGLEREACIVRRRPGENAAALAGRGHHLLPNHLARSP